MVRVNLVNPRNLMDQHLVAEYNEILMLFGYVRKYPSLEGVPFEYCLGTGHIKFFKNKLLYLKKRHELIKEEMKRRGFRVNKKLDLNGFGRTYMNDWSPSVRDLSLIKERLKKKISQKPRWYRYYGEVLRSKNRCTTTP